MQKANLIPAWLRALMAKILIWANDAEYNGALFDYANGKWELLERWSTDKGVEQAVEVSNNMMNRGDDQIYIAVIRCRPDIFAGYFVVHDSDNAVRFRHFWPGIYEPGEAYLWVVGECRKIAKRMGYREPIEREYIAPR